MNKPCMLAIASSYLICSTTAVFAANPAVTVAVDAGAKQTPISPNVYGVAFGSTADLLDLNVPLNRSGGNNTSRYNWNLNADNKGMDWYFESIGDSSAVPGERGDTFIQGSKAAGAQAMLTIPTIGWVAKLGPNRSKLSSFSIAKYGPQTGSDWQWFPDAGNGVSSAAGNPNITGNNPADANVASGSAFQAAWMQHLVGKWGKASAGGLKYYLMDNEPSIWFSTHRDVHPVGPKMDEILSKIVDYGGKVKAADPSALVVGPEEWGWSGYLYSGYDQQYGAAHGWSSYPDRIAHGNMDYLPWLLDQLHKNNVATGKRILDVFTVHYYPQGGEFGSDVSTNMQLLRNRSTRSLWDPSYVDQSWVGTQVDLIPRLKGWVAKYYPGTSVGITEYSWGAEGHINGATTQADVLGILGREGADLATRWVVPPSGSVTYNAFKMYRNYDGAKSTFGETSIQDAAPNPDNVSSFAARRTSDGALTVMLISKYLAGTTSVKVNVANFAGNNVAQAYQLTAANKITRLSDLAVASNAVSVVLPPQSITLLVMPKVGTKVAAPPVPTGLTARAGNAKVTLVWNNAPGAMTYRVYRSAGGAAYALLATVATTDPLVDTAVSNRVTYSYKVQAVNTAGASAFSLVVSATPSALAADAAKYNFEAGTQGWTSGGGIISGATSTIEKPFAGSQSLAVAITSPAGGGSNTVAVSAPVTPAGATVTYHVWIPAGSKIVSVQPYVLQGASGGWAWTGSWTPVANLTANSWNTITVTVPAAAKVPLYTLGVEFATNGAWSGTCYIDSVTW